MVEHSKDAMLQFRIAISPNKPRNIFALRRDADKNFTRNFVIVTCNFRAIHVGSSREQAFIVHVGIL